MKPMHWALHCGAVSLVSSSVAIAAYAMQVAIEANGVQVAPEFLVVFVIFTAFVFGAMTLAIGEQDDRS